MKRITSHLVLFFLSSSFLISCSTEDLGPINDEKLFGVWHEDFLIEENNQISRLEYSFNNDNSYEILRTRIDNTNSEILGYRYRELGNFSLRGKILSFTNIQRYNIDETGQEEFSEIENLQLFSPDFFDAVSKKIEFRDNEKILAFIPPPCPDNAACLKPPLLKKQ